jgi:hypothetical protein
MIKTVRVYNIGRKEHLHPDGMPIIIKWNDIKFKLPEYGDYVEVEDKYARRIVKNHVGLSLGPLMVPVDLKATKAEEPIKKVPTKKPTTRKKKVNNPEVFEMNFVG